MLAMAAMYFYPAISVRLCLYPHGIGVRVGLNRSARSMFRAGVYCGLGFSLKISNKIDDERSGRCIVIAIAIVIRSSRSKTDS